jgi:glucose/arabinose dehydrogenase
MRAGHRRCVAALAVALAGSVVGGLIHASPASAQTPAVEVPPGWQQVDDFVPGSSPGATAVAYAPDGRRFIAEKAGTVRVVLPDGTVVGPIIDITDKVNEMHDRGLLGIAVDKNFDSNGYLYLLYTRELFPATPDTNRPAVSRLSRVTVRPDSTVVESNGVPVETTILGSYDDGACPPADNNIDCIPADHTIHSIGTIRIDPADGTLWLGSGDATTNTVLDQAFRVYDNQSFAGKIIHIDRQGRGLPNHPFCAGNTDLDDVCTKIYAKGFRNPFRFTLRPGKGPIVGDVGFQAREELNLIQAGKSYGWPCYEGDIHMPTYSALDRCEQEYQKELTPDEHVGPNWTYAREAGAAIVAGPAINNPAYPQSFQGDIMVTDYVRGWIKRLEFNANDELLDVHTFATGAYGAVDLQQAPDGNLAYVDIGFDAEPFDDGLRHFVYAPDNDPPVPVAEASPTSGEPPLTVRFDGTDSSDPDGDELTYKWDFGDGTTSTSPNPTHTYEVPKTYRAILTVDDGLGRNPTDTVTITVEGDGPPEATITQPVNNSKFRIGTTVELNGTAVDDNDGDLTGNSVEWQVLLHHNTHIHGIGTFNGTSAAFEALDDHDSDSSYEIRFKATDSADQTDTETVFIQPETSQLTLASAPPGAPISYSGESFAEAPLLKTPAVGYRASIAAAASFVKDGQTYDFTGWSDGGARQHTITVPPVNSTLTASYIAASGTPVNNSPPTIDGTAEQGRQLTADPGTWSGDTPLDYDYQWQTCPTYPAVIKTDSPIAYWRLGETSGTTAVDASNNVRDGSYVEGPVLGRAGAVTGDSDTAVGFQEIGDRVVVADDAALRMNDSFSIEYWAKHNSMIGGFPGFIRKGSSAASDAGYLIFYNSDLRPNFKRAGLQMKSSAAAALSTTKFKHYVITYDEGTQTLKWYANGNLDATYAGVVFPNSSDPASLHLGRGDNYGNHVLDEVALYSRALSTGEVASHYDAGLQGCADLPGADQQSYTATAADVGSRLKVEVKASNTIGWSMAASAPTELVTPFVGTKPANTSLPTIAGVTEEGETLTADRGTWSGTEPIDYDYQWKRCPTYPGEVMENSPLAYWRLGEGSGTAAADESGNARHGEYKTGPELGLSGAITGDPDSAVGFSAIGHRVVVPDDSALRLNGSFSIEYWAKLRSFQGTHPGLFRKGSWASTGTGFGISYGSDLIPKFRRAGIRKKATGAGALSTNEFKHYIITYDETAQTLRWYVNGTLNKTFTGIALPNSVDTSSLAIGRGDKYGDHVIDDVALYSSPLTPGRVGAHFDAGKQGCADIAEATEGTYELTSTDVGSRIKVKVTSTNSAGVASATSSATDVVQPQSSVALGPEMSTFLAMVDRIPGAQRHMGGASYLPNWQ